MLRLPFSNSGIKESNQKLSTKKHFEKFPFWISIHQLENPNSGRINTEEISERGDRKKKGRKINDKKIERGRRIGKTEQTEP